MKNKVSWFGKSIIFLTILLVVNQIYGLIMNWLHLPVSRASYLMVLIVYAIMFFKFFKAKTLINRRDVVSLVLVVVTIGTFVKPLLEYNKSFRLPIISEGVDIAAHYNMFSAMLDNHGLNYGKGNFDNFKPWSGWTEYPPGFYENAAIFFNLVVPPDSPNYSDAVTRTSFISVFSIAVYCLLVYWFSVLIVEIFKTTKKKLTIIRILIIVSLGLAACELVLYKIFSFGFMAQLLALVLLIFGWWLVNNKGLYLGWKYWALLLLVNFGIANTWYFLSPIILAVMLVEAIKVGYFKKWWFYGLSLIWLVPTLYPVWMSVKSYNISSEINAGGGVMVINGLVMVIIFLILSAIKKTKSDVFIILAVVYTLVVGLSQIVLNGTTGYYYTKSLYTVFIFLSAELIAFGCKKLVSSKQKMNFNRLVLWLMSVVVIFISLKYLPGEGMSMFSKREYFLNKEKYDGLMVLRETDIGKEHYVVPFGDFKDTLWFYSYLGYLPDFYSEMWPRIDYESYPWIFEKMKDIRSEKPVMIFDAYTVNKLFEKPQIEYILKNKIPVYPENVDIRN